MQPATPIFGCVLPRYKNLPKGSTISQVSRKPRTQTLVPPNRRNVWEYFLGEPPFFAYRQSKNRQKWFWFQHFFVCRNLRCSSKFFSQKIFLALVFDQKWVFAKVFATHKICTSGTRWSLYEYIAHLPVASKNFGSWLLGFSHWERFGSWIWVLGFWVLGFVSWDFPVGEDLGPG